MAKKPIQAMHEVSLRAAETLPWHLFVGCSDASDARSQCVQVRCCCEGDQPAHGHSPSEWGTPCTGGILVKLVDNTHLAGTFKFTTAFFSLLTLFWMVLVLLPGWISGQPARGHSPPSESEHRTPLLWYCYKGYWYTLQKQRVLVHAVVTKGTDTHCDNKGQHIGYYATDIFVLYTISRLVSQFCIPIPRHIILYGPP